MTQSAQESVFKKILDAVDYAHEMNSLKGNDVYVRTEISPEFSSHAVIQVGCFGNRKYSIVTSLECIDLAKNDVLKDNVDKIIKKMGGME